MNAKQNFKKIKMEMMKNKQNIFQFVYNCLIDNYLFCVG